MDLKEIRGKARALAKGYCRVCPSCNGWGCAGEIPGMGGAGTAASFKRNLRALANLEFATSLIHEVRRPELATEVMGIALSMPLMIAPIGGISFNLGGPVGEGDYQRAIGEGALAAGISCGTPDAAAEGVFEVGLAEAGKPLGGGIMPFVKPWEPELVREKLALANAAGCRTVAMDLDSVGLATLRLMKRPCLPKSLKELSEIIADAHSLGLKFALKGVMTPQDAIRAVEAGADGIVVSNHGGRVMDFMPGTADILRATAAAVKGKAAVFCDGGVRAGGDILKLLALGADCVMVGRPFAVAAVGGGAEGVRLQAEEYRQELETAMVMTATPSIHAVSPAILRQRSSGAMPM
ncbi:MAG: alpha-hydroxy-acid oxidizing protein [Deltaproteobacteria bacterium]|jgi:isopentenyl diphosphate isomerase/L-lactate dehydrogenase-like FMN-dependent dehydrogenase|nr:alpha-hydroxy-acid oxidizing protein [Deltaproteobacteria bacterium]